MNRKTLVTTLGIAAIAVTTALASVPAPGPVDIAACSVASRAQLLEFSRAYPGTSYLEACKAAK